MGYAVFLSGRLTFYRLITLEVQCVKAFCTLRRQYSWLAICGLLLLTYFVVSLYRIIKVAVFCF